MEQFHGWRQGEINERRVTETAEHITQEGLNCSNASIFPPNTVMVAMNGQGATRGKASMLGIPATCNQSLAAIQSNKHSIEQFLFHVLDSAYEKLRALTGDGRSGLNLHLIRTFRLLVPPLPEQRAIAAVLDSIDEAIERTEAVIAATERLRDALLHELLTRGVPGWHSEWKDAPGIGTIPACWKVVRLGNVLKTTTYGTNAALSEEGGIFVLRMNNLQDGELDLSDMRKADLSVQEVRELDLVTGDILFNRTNSLALVGKVAIVRNPRRGLSFASYLVRLRARKARANAFWLSALLGSNTHQGRIRRFATPGVSQANINPTSLKGMMIPLPTLHEQQTIDALLDSIHYVSLRERAQTDALRSVRASACDVLLTGRARVTKNEVFGNG